MNAPRIRVEVFDRFPQPDAPAMVDLTGPWNAGAMEYMELRGPVGQMKLSPEALRDLCAIYLRALGHIVLKANDLALHVPAPVPVKKKRSRR